MSSFLKRTVAALALTGLAVSGQTVAHAQTAPVSFNISGITDLHGHFETKDGEPGAAVLACVLPLAAEGNEQVFVSSGDNIGGSAFSSALLNDEPTIEILNAMGLYTSAVGNHEFDQGYADLAGRVSNLADFEYLGANVEGESPELAPYVIKELETGIKVAFIGSVTASTKDKVSPAGIASISFTDPYAATNAAADKITAEGAADVVVALIHEGFSEPSQFNNNVDIAFAGDSHLVVNQVITRADGSKFALVQGDHYGKGLADVDVTIDPATKKITDLKAQVWDAATMVEKCGATPVASIQALVDKATAQAEVAGNEVVATINHDFYRGANETGETGANRGTESTLSNLIAEATKQAIATKTSVKPDLGVMNAGGVRADLEKGEVTYAEAFAVQPFGNELTYASYTGAEIKQALEQQWKDNDPEASRPMLHLGWSDNFAYTYDPSKPWGERVTSMSIDGKPMDMNKEYIVAGSTFLLGGGDGFAAFGNESSTFPNTGIMDVDGFISYLKDTPNVTPRAGQSNVGVTIAEPLEAGKTAKIELSSLIYTKGDSASKVTVKLGDKEATAAITPTIEAKTPGSGTATVEIEVPADLSGTVDMTITTDAGTNITMPVEVKGGATTTPTPTPTPVPVANQGGGLFGLLGFFAVLAALIGSLFKADAGLGSAVLNLFPPAIRGLLSH